MQTARRLYMYLMSGVSLGVLLVGLSSLLTVTLHAAGIGRGELAGGTTGDREQLSLAIALIVVGLIVWTIHWLLVERSLRGNQPGREQERRSAVRALYLTVVLTVLLAIGAVAGMQLLQAMVRRLLGAADGGSFVFAQDSGSSLATLLVTGMAWTYHAAIRRRDLGGSAIDGAATWIPRVYLYGAALLGLVLTAISIGTLLVAALASATGDAAVFGDADFRRRAVADAVAGVIGWGVVFVGHWWYANGLIHDPSWRGASERAARLRLAYYAAVIGASAIAVVVLGSQSLSSAIRIALGTEEAAVQREAVLAIGGPAISLIPWIAAWWLHLRWLRGEALASDDEGRIGTIDRLDAAVASLVGLATTSFGVGGLLTLVFDGLLGGNRLSGQLYRSELATYLGAGLIGSVIWLWHWARLQRRSATSPGAEAGSTLRRAYLLIIVAAAVITSLGSAAYLLYRLVSAILGVEQFDNVASSVAPALASLATAAVLAIYHSLVLRRDQALRGAAAEEEGLRDGAEAPALPPSQRILVLTGPAGTDLEQTVTAMRAALGPDLRLEDRAPEP